MILISNPNPVTLRQYVSLLDSSQYDFVHFRPKCVGFCFQIQPKKPTDGEFYLTYKSRSLTTSNNYMRLFFHPTTQLQSGLKLYRPQLLHTSQNFKEKQVKRNGRYEVSILDKITNRQSLMHSSSNKSSIYIRIFKVLTDILSR